MDNENDFIDELFEELATTIETWFSSRTDLEVIDLEMDELEGSD